MVLRCQIDVTKSDASFAILAGEYSNIYTGTNPRQVHNDLFERAIEALKKTGVSTGSTLPDCVVRVQGLANTRHVRYRVLAPEGEDYPFIFYVSD